MEFLDCKKQAHKMIQQLKQATQATTQLTGKKPSLLIVLASHDDASRVYTKRKIKIGEEVGMQVDLLKIESRVTQEDLETQIKDVLPQYDGVIFQLPMFDHLEPDRLIQLLSVNQDVDGLKPESLGLLCSSVSGNRHVAATALGVEKLLYDNQIDLDGKLVVVLGRSDLFGKPMQGVVQNMNGTLVCLNSHTPKRLAQSLCQQAQVVISATGQPLSIDSSYISDETVLIDVGITLGEDGKLKGDFDLEEIRAKRQAILATKTPNGTGQLTVPSLLENVFSAFCYNQHLIKEDYWSSDI